MTSLYKKPQKNLKINKTTFFIYKHEMKFRYDKETEEIPSEGESKSLGSIVVRGDNVVMISPPAE